MKKLFLFCSFLFFSFGFSFGQSECDMDETDISVISTSRSHCENGIDHFQNAPLLFHSVPFKEVNLLIHIIRDGEGLQNYQNNPSDIAKINSIIDNMNTRFSNLEVQNPLGVCDPPSVHISDAKIGFNVSEIKFYDSEQFYCTDTRDHHSDLFENFVTNNPDLSPEEKANNLHVIIVAYRGGGLNRDDCDDPQKHFGGSGIRGEDYCAVRSYYYKSSIGEIAGHLSHEVGHTLGLWHSWQDGSEGVCDTGGGKNGSNNIMDYTSHYDNAFTQRQIAKMHYWIENEENGGPQPYLKNDLCDKQDTKIVIPAGTDVHWDTDEIVSEDVEIYGSLKITCEVKVADDVKFTVFRGGKLQVDGGHIFGCNEWQGIIVEGDAEHFSQANAGEVEFTNLAVIENAVNAVSMKPIHIPWPERSKYYGGLVTAIDASFLNCRRAVQFMKYGTGIIKDKSTFTNCTFDGMKYAITIWANNGIKIDNCHFNNITQYAVHPYNSEVFIENGCVFENMPMGVNIINTFPQPFAPQIGDENTNSNDFSCSEYGVHATTTGSTDPLDIVNNNFLGGEVGIHVGGESYFEIHHNDLFGYTGIGAEEISTVAAVSTGFQDNKIFENNIHSSLYGSRAIWENPGLRYLFNCFDFNTTTDVLIEQGSIHPFQEGLMYDTNGSDTTEAGNCFTKGIVPEIDNTGNAIISYFVDPDVQPLDCKFLDNSLNVTQAPGDLAELAAGCGSVNSPGNINVNSFCGGPFKDKQEILDRIASIEAYITQIENTTYPSAAYKEYLLAKYQKCLDRLLAQTGIIILVPDKEPVGDPHGLLRMEEFISFYSANSDFNYQILAYGMMVQLNDITRARTYLNSLTANTTEKQDFVWAQNINLDYLENTTNYVLAVSDETQLYTIARKSDPLAGYARSIYEALTEIKVDLDLPDSVQGSTKRNSEKADELELQNQIKISPNPAFDYITISSANEEIRKISIIDLSSSIIAKEISGNQDRVKIDISALPKGVYIVLVETALGETVTEKLVKL